MFADKRGLVYCGLNEYLCTVEKIDLLREMTCGIEQRSTMHELLCNVFPSSIIRDRSFVYLFIYELQLVAFLVRW